MTIATAWKDQFGQNYPATLIANVELPTLGTIPNPGDGLSVLEEYRGFIVMKDEKKSPSKTDNFTHIRTNPVDEADLFFVWEVAGTSVQSHQTRTINAINAAMVIVNNDMPMIKHHFVSRDMCLRYTTPNRRHPDGYIIAANTTPTNNPQRMNHEIFGQKAIYITHETEDIWQSDDTWTLERMNSQNMRNDFATNTSVCIDMEHYNFGQGFTIPPRKLAHEIGHAIGMPHNTTGGASIMIVGGGWRQGSFLQSDINQFKMVCPTYVNFQNNQIAP